MFINVAFNEEQIMKDALLPNYMNLPEILRIYFEASMKNVKDPG